MVSNIKLQSKSYWFNLQKPLDISIPLQNGNHNPNAFYIQSPIFEPFKSGDFIGSITAGGSVNCFNLHVNPHGNGTHTECVGHIVNGFTINNCLKQFFFIAQLISIEPITNNEGDLIITSALLEPKLMPGIQALIVRTKPNATDKKNMQYSGKNPCYFSAEVCEMLAQKKIRHLVTDLPSVDREQDDGKLAAHKAFWQLNGNIRYDATITEMAYIDNQITDGLYVLQLMIAPIESDASPSKPVLYRLEDNELNI